MTWSWANIDWASTAAVAQAVGSVAAIFVAILIDQGTARRQRRERKEADRIAREARLRCIENCAASLEQAADEIAGVDFSKIVLTSFSTATARAMAAARELLGVYRASSWEADPRVLVAVVYTERVMKEAASFLMGHPRIPVDARTAVVDRLRDHAKDIRSLQALTATAEL